MDYELPKEFDLIVIGTGLVESIVSAAASRVGKRVLHVDSNSYYGGLWASFNLDVIQKLNDVIRHGTKEFSINEEFKKQNETAFPLGNDIFSLKDFQVEWHIPEKENEISKTEEGEDHQTARVTHWTQEKILKESRKFNIDLSPKLQFARGEFVELLISSNIARYSEYRSVSRVLTWLNGQLETVPCSRSDVFANSKVTVIEKRMLMKLFLSLDDSDQEYVGCENKTFQTFLKEKKLTSNLIHYVLYAISMSTDDTSCLQGIQNTKRFLNSLGRFGKTPFLFSMYGSGEVTQAFCRLSAVFGGVYALNRQLNGLIVDNCNVFRGISCDNQRIDAEYLVMGVEYSPRQFVDSPPLSYLSRAVLITDKSILESEKEHLTLVFYPPEDDRNSCVVIELGTLTGTCPKNLYLVHVISKQIKDPQHDLSQCIKNLFKETVDEGPRILWSCYFSIPDSNDLNLKLAAPQNVKLCPGPDSDLDYDFSVRKARGIFNDIFPDLEFLPRAPDPEEIIIEGDTTVNTQDEEIALRSETSHHRDTGGTK